MLPGFQPSDEAVPRGDAEAEPSEVSRYAVDAMTCNKSCPTAEPAGQHLIINNVWHEGKPILASPWRSEALPTTVLDTEPQMAVSSMTHKTLDLS